jgi:hypothetical protein
MDSSARSMIFAVVVLPLFGSHSAHSSIVTSYVVDIYDINCAEAHGFAVLSSGPQRDDELSASVGVGFPLRISKRDFSIAVLGFYGDEGVAP